MADHDSTPPPASADAEALRKVRHRLGAAEDGVDNAIIQLRTIRHVPGDWRDEYLYDLSILTARIETFRTLLHGR